MTVAGMESLAQLVADHALNSILGGLLIAAFAWLVLRIVGKQNSGTRFAVWFSALIAIAGLPFVPNLTRAGAMSHAMRAEVTLPGAWAVAIFAVWILFAAFAGSRVLVGFWNLRRLRRSGVALEPSQLHPTLRETLATCEAVRPVRVCSSPNVKVPTVIGFFKPVILIPEWALQELQVEELRIILLHEFAHLRRWDDWTNLAQKIVRTVFFFHPAVWWIEKRLSLEREMACDDTVLAETGNPRAYAECLVSLAERSFVQRSLALAQAAISRACETSVRLAQILDADRPRATRVFKPALGLMTSLAAMCLVMLPHAPRLIAFGDTVQPQSIVAAKNKDNVPRLRQSLVVPVTARTGVDSTAMGIRKVVATPAMYRPAKSSASKFNHGSSHAMVSARRQQRLRPVLALPVAAKSSIQTPNFLVVMQTTEFDERGAVITSVSVWQVIFVTPRVNAVQAETVSKAI